MRISPRNKPNSKSSRKNGLIVIIFVLMAIATMFAAAFFLSPKRQDINCDFPKIVDSPQTKDYSQKIRAKIYVDGTPSMNGFVFFEGSRYRKTLRSLNTAITDKWQDAQSEVYRFGNNNRELLSSDGFLNAQKSVFYPKSPDEASLFPWFENSELNDVFKSVNPSDDDLILVITDLTESNQNMRDMFETLKQKYINAGFAVGVFAQRSEFNGTVYDVGINNESFNWNTSSPEHKNDAKFYRPFYILMLGRYANIAYLYDRLTNSEPELVKGGEFLIFDRNIINAPIALNPSKSSSSKFEGIVQGINYQGALVELDNKNLDKVQMLRLLPEKIYKYRYRIDQQAALPHSAATFARAVNYTVDSDWFDPAIKEFRKDNSAKQFVQFKEVQFNNQQTEFEIIFSPNKDTNGVYKFTLISYIDRLLPIPWFKEWSSNESNKSNGARTFNVEQLLNSLHQLVITANKERSVEEKLMSKFCFVAEIH